MSIPHRPSRIVYVDDDFDARKLLRESYEAQRTGDKIVLATCGGGQELLSRLRELQPELIILDLHMPAMDGLETLHRLRVDDDGKDIPVIFLSGNPKFVMEETYKALGVIDILRKPFDLESLPNEVLKIWQNAFGFSEEGVDGRVLSELMDEDEDGPQS